MAAIIRSGATTDQLTIDATSKAARATLYDTSGGVLVGQKTMAASLPVVIASDQTRAWKDVESGYVGTYAAASWRTVGTVATAQPLMTIVNNAGARAIAIRRLTVDVNVSAAAAFLTQAYFRFWLNTGVTPSGGAAPTKHPLRSSYSASMAATEILFASSADGTAAAITHATPAATPTREQAQTNVLTAVGQYISDGDIEVVTFDQHPLYVLTGETAALILICSANNIATNHYTVKIIWEEFTP